MDIRWSGKPQILAPDQREWHVKIGQANAKDDTGRIIPRAVWQDQLDYITPQVLEKGQLAGAYDPEIDFNRGVLSEVCMLWRALTLKDDGAVYGSFKLIDTRCGRNFLSQVRAGLPLRFVIVGYGSAHPAGDAERKEYGLTSDEDALVIDRNFHLTRIDVTHP